MSKKSDSDKKYLRIGDYVTLKSVKFEGFLNAEGILNEELFVSNDMSLFDEDIFCIHFQRQYSAARELEEFLDIYGVETNNIQDESTAKYLKALERGRSNENELNNVYMTKKMGQIVLFGDVIQLFHVKSCKYLQIVPNELARAERENLRIRLDTSGNSYSWLQIMPRYKIDKEGDRILTNNEVYLKIAERPNEFIHCAEKRALNAIKREVNCSLEECSWRLNIFQSSVDSSNPENLMAGQVVYVHDPETKTGLTMAHPTVDDLDDEANSVQSGGVLGDILPSIVLAPMQEEFVDSNFLWYMESVSLINGGPIYWKTEQVRFKHLNTGLYLKQDTVLEDGQFRYVYCTSLTSEDEGTLISVAELVPVGARLSNGKPLQLGHSNVWLERGEVHEDLSFKLIGTADRSAATSLIIHRFEEKVEGIEAPTESSGAKEPFDVFSGLSSRLYLRKYLDMIVIPKSDVVSTLWPQADRSDMTFFGFVIEKTVYFSQGFPISASNIELGVDKADVNMRIRRQHLLREQGVLEVLLRMISKLIVITKRSEAIANLTGKQQAAVSEDEHAMIKMGHVILNKCFHLLFYSIQDHPENQMYVADYMPVLLSHLGNNQPLASKCVTEMLSNNMELQETKIGTREIAIFVDKLRSSKMGSMYLNLLQSCCSCQGDGVDNNQCKVAEMLFSDTNDIIIQIHADNGKALRVDWSLGSSLYIPTAPVPGSPVFGSSLISRGLPTLSLSWTTKSIDFSPLGLFGKLSVKVEELFGILPTLNTSKNRADISQKMKQKRNPVHDQKSVVANYFIAEMYLGAEMCLDRNYVAMHLLDPLFTYEMLVTMMKMEVDTKLKSAAVRLLMCLHVDRDPQAETKIPCLTRTWSEVQKNPVPKLPYVEVQRRNYFALIQQLISEHIRQMAGTRWDEYSQHMLKMLRTLVVFNFYGETDRLNDVIGPLIQALDRRQVEFQVAESTVLLSKPKSKGGKKGKSSRIAVAAIEDVSKDEESKSLENVGQDNSATFDSIMVGETPDSKIPWQKRLLDFLESIPVLIAVLGLVFVAVGLTVYVSITGATDTPGTWLFDVGIIIMCIFIIEIVSRAYCYLHVNGELWSFANNWFNQIDMAVISLDLIFLGIPTNGGSSYTKVVRLVRLLRLLRILRAARVVNKLTDAESTADAGWKPPIRYTKAPIHELETMVEAVAVLSYCQQVIDDRNISLFLRHFYAWECGDDKRSPREIFENIIEDAKQLSLGITDFDNIMIDVLMFVHTPLVQGSLELLMAHHSLRRTLLNNAKEVQLLVSHRRERQYKLVDQMLQQLERNAETHELWGELESDSDHAINKQTKDIIRELTDVLRVRRSILEFDEEFMADTEMQNLFRNLGCFNIAMKVLGLLDSVDPDENGEYGEVALNTRELCLLCNDLMYWFLLGNPKNQELGYGELEFFLDSLDASVNSHRVIRAMFKDNEALMKLVPHSHLTGLAEKICKEGKNHHYLSLFAAITYVGDKNIPKNQFEVMKTLTSPGILQKILCYFVPVNHPDYAEKQEQMEQYRNVKDVSIDQLPQHLAYHLTLLEVLSGCTVGRMNVTTVEAKLQSVYNVIDIIDAILDPKAILIAKIRLSMFLFNAVIEVEMLVPGLEKSNCMWNLLCTYPEVLKHAKTQLELVEKLGWGSAQINRQQIEYGVICTMIVGAFFARYYDAATFKLDEGIASIGDKVTMSISEVNDLIIELFHTIKSIYDLNSPHLTNQFKVTMFDTVEALNKSATKVIASDIDKLHSSEADINLPESQEEIDNDLEKKVTSNYKRFLSELDKDAEVQASVNGESMEFIRVMEALPYLNDPQPADIRYESFIKKLVSHVKENIKIINNEKRLDARCTRTTIWIIKAFRTMIENRMGMSIYERDEDGGEEQDIAAGPVVNALNSCGATTLCLDLIAVGIDEELQNEAIKLCVAMLFKEGGALEVQETMYNYLSKNPTELFFKQVRLTLQKLIAWHKWHGVIELSEGQDPELPDDIIIVRFLQLMCEGHYLNNQDIMREQPKNHGSVNLLDDFVLYINTLSRIPCRSSTAAAIRVTATILEVIQGPCVGNQVHFALNTELIETLNRTMRAKVIRDCVEEEEFELKHTALAIFRGLLEGQGAKSVVYVRVLSVIHLDVIQVMAKPPEEEQVEGEDGASTTKKKTLSEDEAALQTEAMVLLQMFCDFKPSLHEELGVSRKVEDMAALGTACIEVMWHGVLNRRFFHVPEICHDLAKTTKDRFVEEVNRENQENKLIDFLERARGMYREVKHQQVLKELNLSRFFSPKIQDQVTWLSFTISCVINSLFLLYYKLDGDNPVLPANVKRVVDGFNICQLISAFITLVQYLVVKSPVIYQSYAESGCSQFETLIGTACDGMTLYYFAYLILSILGFALADYYLALLLLDIVVKNSTTRDVLRSVVSPRKQLAMAFILGVFVIYIYAFFIFWLFRDQFGTTCGAESCCVTLYDCMKMTFGYGLRFGGGIADAFMVDTASSRLIVDISYYCVVLVVLLNVIFGIIIDTFSSLRADKVERLKDTTEFCFICGIDKQTFDRAYDGPEGFKYHIKMEHNMWNYLFFIFYLWEQDKDDDDGMEQYVRRAVDNTSITWFPINKAMSLNQEASENEVLTAELRTCVQDNYKVLNERVQGMDADLKVVLTSVMEILTQSNVDMNGGNAAVAGVTSADNMSQASEVPRTNHLMVAVLAISNTGVPEKDITAISCRIISDSAMFSIPCSSACNGTIALFDGENLKTIYENALEGDKRTCSIQVLLGTNGSDRVGKYLGQVEIEVGELMKEAGKELERPLLTQEGKTSDILIKFRVECKAVAIDKSIDEDDDAATSDEEDD